MVKEQFKDLNIRADRMSIIQQANAIIDEYISQGMRMTLRQLYYRFIAMDLFPNKWIDEEYNAAHGLAPDTKNTVKNYGRLGDIISDGRLAGIIDWDAIEDREREPIIPVDWLSLNDMTEQAFKSYRLPRWEGQKRYAEVWIEKKGLIGVLESVTREYHVPLIANKGYASQSAMYESAKRYLGAIMGVDPRNCPACKGSGSCAACGGDGVDVDVTASDESCVPCRGTGACPKCRGKSDIAERRKEPWLFYIGDHDPSGEDMVRDIKERMVMFGVNGIRVFKIALTMKQIDRYDPPPNPTKATDSRAQAYIDKYGDDCWEVDALPPNVLAQIVRDALDRCIDRPRMDAIITRENADRERLRKAVAKLE